MVGPCDPYADFGDLYDSMTSDSSIQAYYREWRHFLLEALRRYKVKCRVFIDIACGTGNTTIPWTKRRGWTIFGVDRSPAMLRQARKKSKRVRWYRQDLGRLNLKVGADVVTCHFDALNHILVHRDLQQVFLNVARMLNEGGLFQFDMNTEYWFRWLRTHEKIFRLGPNFMMAWNTYNPERRLATFHQLWFVRKTRLYEKREIRVRERAYTSAEIRGMINKAGLGLLKIDIQRKIEGKPARLLYLVGKPRKG